jgi:hypothetical protein
MFGAPTEGEDNNHPGRALANEIREKTVAGIEIAGRISDGLNAWSPGFWIGWTGAFVGSLQANPYCRTTSYKPQEAKNV